MQTCVLCAWIATNALWQPRSFCRAGVEEALVSLLGKKGATHGTNKAWPFLVGGVICLVAELARKRVSIL